MTIIPLCTVATKYFCPFGFLRIPTQHNTIEPNRTHHGTISPFLTLIYLFLNCSDDHEEESDEEVDILNGSLKLRRSSPHNKWDFDTYQIPKEIKVEGIQKKTNKLKEFDKCENPIC